jgi:hypothetical protein
VAREPGDPRHDGGRDPDGGSAAHPLASSYIIVLRPAPFSSRSYETKTTMERAKQLLREQAEDGGR